QSAVSRWFCGLGSRTERLRGHIPNRRRRHTGREDRMDAGTRRLLKTTARRRRESLADCSRSHPRRVRIVDQAAPLCYTGAIEYTTDNRDDVRDEEDVVTGGDKEEK